VPAVNSAIHVLTTNSRPCQVYVKVAGC